MGIPVESGPFLCVPVPLYPTHCVSSRCVPVPLYPTHCVSSRCVQSHCVPDPFGWDTMGLAYGYTHTHTHLHHGRGPQTDWYSKEQGHTFPREQRCPRNSWNGVSPWQCPGLRFCSITLTTTPPFPRDCQSNGDQPLTVAMLYYTSYMTGV